MGGETDFGGCSDINLVDTLSFKTTQLLKTLQFNFVNHNLNNATLKTDKVISMLITDQHLQRKLVNFDIQSKELKFLAESVFGRYINHLAR